MRGKCSLKQEIVDHGCMLSGRPCGQNMVFKTVIRGNIKTLYAKCFVKCECDVDYKENDGECILMNDSITRFHNPVNNKKSLSTTKYSLENFDLTSIASRKLFIFRFYRYQLKFFSAMKGLAWLVK